MLTTPARKQNPRGKPIQPTLLLAHGAGAPMDSPFMAVMADQLAARGVSVVRFEFGYMAARRTQGKKRPPPKAEKLCDEYRQAVASVTASGPLLIGGKSMGGRVASLIADEFVAQGRIQGLVCLGYPFHPPAKPEKLRTAHLAQLQCPALIVQGEDDTFGTRAEVASYSLSAAIRLHWITGGDHDLVRKVSPGTSKSAARDAAWEQAADAVSDFAREVGGIRPSPSRASRLGQR